LDDLLTKVVTVRFRHMLALKHSAEKGKGLLSVYAQTALAVAILPRWLLFLELGRFFR